MEEKPRQKVSRSHLNRGGEGARSGGDADFKGPPGGRRKSGWKTIRDRRKEVELNQKKRGGIRIYKM